MIALFLLPIYILVQIYIIRWLLKWMICCHKLFNHKLSRFITIFIYSFFASALLIGFILPSGQLKRFFNSIGNYFLGVMLYIFLVVLIADLIRFIAIKKKWYNQNSHNKRKIFVINGAAIIIIVLAVSLYGAINARIVRTTHYDISINKKASLKDLNIVMIADLHLGNNIGVKQIKKMVKAINHENPDVVLIAGDIFDNDYNAIEKPNEIIKLFRSIKSKNGIYAVYGNHDVKESILAGFTFNYKEKKLSDKRMDDLLKQANIKLLKDEYILLNNEIQIYGRPDYKKPNRGVTLRKSPEEIVATLDKNKPIIIFEHEPVELSQLGSLGVDLDLNGHTHNGQLFPENIFVKLIFDNAYGYKKFNQMHSIVTSGVGVYGPNMRVLTKAEITSIHINFI